MQTSTHNPNTQFTFRKDKVTQRKYESHNPETFLPGFFTQLKNIITPEKVLKTNNDWTGLIMRLTTGLILLPHAMQHSTGWFGGFGYAGMMNWFTTVKNIPPAVGFLVIAVEVLGSVGLILGFASRLWAFAVVILMTGIIFSSHLEFGFFMNWINNQDGEGYEYHLLFIGLCLAIIINGGGKYSVDGMLKRKTGN